MAKDKKKNDAAKNAKPKKQDAKAAKDLAPKKGKGGSKSGPVTEKKPNIFARLVTYLTEVRAELKRVTWPTREKVIYLVGVVAVTLVFFATFTALVDWGASEGVVGLNSLVHGAPEAPAQIPVELDLDGFEFGNDDGSVIDEGVVGANDDGGLTLEFGTDGEDGADNGGTDEADE